MPFGHPFGRGDIPAGSRLAATWEGAAVPVQVSGRVLLARRLAPVRPRRCAKLPAVAGSASGTLALLSESGTQSTTIPGGATVASVLADLRPTTRSRSRPRTSQGAQDDPASRRPGPAYAAGRHGDDLRRDARPGDRSPIPSRSRPGPVNGVTGSPATRRCAYTVDPTAAVNTSTGAGRIVPRPSEQPLASTGRARGPGRPTSSSPSTGRSTPAAGSAAR